MHLWQITALVVAAYLLGSVSFAWLFAKKLEGIDLRTFGSGNLGATNAGRLLGRRMAIVIYVLDFAKGFVPVFLLRVWAGDPLVAGTLPVALLAGLAAFIGHCFPIWHGFHGGKGVATASGVILGLTPVVGLIVAAVFALAVLVSRMISVGSVSGAASLPLAQLALREGSTPRAASWTLGLYVVIAAVVIARHHRNLRRLFTGEESRIGRRNAGP